MTRIKLRKVFSRRYWTPIAVALLIVTVAALINLYGIHVAGSLENWQQWRADSYWYFFAWRVVLYAALVVGWIWMRRRTFQREPSMRRRINRAEIAVAAAVLLMEFTRAQPHLA